MARILSSERQELVLEAAQLREFGWTQEQISHTLQIPRRTIRDWLKLTANGTIVYPAIKPQNGDIYKYTNGGNITLYPTTYENISGKIKAESIDLILTDPPYLVSHNNMPRKNQRELQRDFGDWDTIPQEQYKASVLVWAKSMSVHLKPGGSLYLFTSHRQMSLWGEALEQAGLSDNGILVWHRTNPAPQIRKTRWCPAFDLILFFSKESPRIFRWIEQNRMHNVITGPICMGNERQWHPTQKPRWLLEKLLWVSSKPGSQILDPFAGSGSTAFAASRLPGRHTTLVEPEPKYIGLIQSIAKELQCKVTLELS